MNKAVDLVDGDTRLLKETVDRDTRLHIVGVSLLIAYQRTSVEFDQQQL